MIVLDTHAWIWWAVESPRLSARARAAAVEAESLGVCAISCWEVAMLVVKGRMRLDRDTLAFVRQALALPRVELLPITPEVAVASTTIAPEFRGDPADRMIAATALALDAPVITRDRRLKGLPGLKTVW